MRQRLAWLAIAESAEERSAGDSLLMKQPPGSGKIHLVREDIDSFRRVSQVLQLQLDTFTLERLEHLEAQCQVRFSVLRK